MVIFFIDDNQSRYASGANKVKFPRGGYAHSFPFADTSDRVATQNILQTSGMNKADTPILGLVEVGGGRIAVYGDSNCLDSSHMVTNCRWLLRKILNFTSRNIKDAVLFLNSASQDVPLDEDDGQLPSRRTDVNFSSPVLGEELICSRFEIWGTKGYGLQVRRNRKLPAYPTNGIRRDLESSSLAWTKLQKNEANSSASVSGNRYSKTIDFLGLLNRDEVDMPIQLASKWLAPAVAVSGLLLLLSFWRIRQK